MGKRGCGDTVVDSSLFLGTRLAMLSHVIVDNGVAETFDSGLPGISLPSTTVDGSLKSPACRDWACRHGQPGPSADCCTGPGHADSGALDKVAHSNDGRACQNAQVQC